MKLKVLFALVFLTGLSSCYYDNKEELYLEFPNDCITTEMTYTLNIQSIVSTNCLGCHAAGGVALPTLETIDQLKTNKIKIIDRITRELGDPAVMPQGGPMAKCNIDQILAWYADGAPL